MKTNKPKHTPGPWMVSNEGIHELGPLIYSDRESGQPLALVYELKNHQQDAALISAAPDMLKALDAVLNDNKLMNAMSKEQARLILKALAKARGES